MSGEQNLRGDEGGADGDSCSKMGGVQLLLEFCRRIPPGLQTPLFPSFISSGPVFSYFFCFLRLEPRAWPGLSKDSTAEPCPGNLFNILIN